MSTSDLLSQMTLFKGKLLILGDFDVHFDDSESVESKQLNALFEPYNLHQHVSLPTHQQGHTIDLSLTRADDAPEEVWVTDPLISDHSAVIFQLSTSKPPVPVRTLQSRNFQAFDTAAFRRDIQESELASVPNSSDPEQIASLCTKITTHILDKHAPLKTRTVAIRTRAPWFTNNIKCARREMLRLFWPKFTNHAKSGARE